VERVELPPSFKCVEDVVWSLVCKGVADFHGADYQGARDRMSERMHELVERGQAISTSKTARR